MKSSARKPNITDEARGFPDLGGRAGLVLLLLLALDVLNPLAVAHAYVGPGAGFAFVSSFLTLLAGFFLGIFYLLTSPIRLLLTALVRGRRRGKNSVRRVIILGLDGMDPQLAERYMDQGKLPNLRRLAQQGGFAPLATSYPAVSPVAWSSFMTGVDASHHNIFDFITRDPRTYEPMLSSASVKPPRRTLSIGPWRIPLSRPRIISYRRSRSFWSILGEHGVFSSVIRVPITFPVERFRGVLLAGMCVPDLRGSQGTYSFFTTDQSVGAGIEGTRVVVARDGNRIEARLLGPENGVRKNATPLAVPFRVEIDDIARTAQLSIDGQTIRLEERKHSPWVQVDFRAGLGIRVSGICRFYLKSVTPHFQLYVTPVQIDPQRPALPLSHPFAYSVYLSRLLGRFATLGLAEDTSAVNEGVLDEDGFLEQAYLYHEERERMFFDALEKTRDGLCVCVFDVTDRVQHMFFRAVADDAPGDTPAAGDYERRGQETIEDLYVRMDRLVGRVLDQLGAKDVLMVMSDHGFAPFRRGVNLNTWLLQNGYLALKDGALTCGEWLREVDWTRTKAFSLGLAGIFVNRKGREARGIVHEDGELSELRRELVLKLGELVDPKTGTKAVTRVIETEKAFPGPYASDGPDLLVCYRRGHRVSWEGASGKVTAEVFEENDRAWSGDHCMDPESVPGVLFSNLKLTNRKPDIKDIAPTVLSLFGVPIPVYMKGKPAVAGPEPDPERKAPAVTIGRIAGIVALLLLLAGCGSPAPAKKVVILGLDGLDPLITKRLMAEGKLPHFAKLASAGGYTELGTSNPAESPVAWSNFITGLDPGGHGIFDFIHRDPATLTPYLSSTTTEESGWHVPLGKWQLPIWPGQIRLNRAGRAFWEILEEHGVPCTIIRIPANYPPTDCPAKQLSGMGTPDLEGTYGTFSFYTDEPEGSHGEISGGRIHYVKVVGDRVQGELSGPPNGFRRDRAQVSIPFDIFIDSAHPVAKILIQETQVLLKTGEWSDWVPVSFPVLPLAASVRGMVRFYLKEVRPDFKLYVSPVNVDPSRPVLPISAPPGYARELTSRVGLYATLGIPEDTKAVSSGILSGEEFLQYWQLLHEEELRLLEDQLRTFQSGLLFFYSGRADQLQHMFWRSNGNSTEERLGITSPEIERAYQAMETLVARVLGAAGPDSLVIALSDHGFAGFRRAFSLNNWLVEEGYAVRGGSAGRGYLEGFDWTRTRAYGLGFAGLYLNLRGRERAGTVSEGEKDRLLEQLSRDLVEMRDPVDGGQVITRVLRGDRIYSGPLARSAPDLVVCYNRGYRASWETVLGLFSEETLADNQDQWSGDHLMDPDLVPGVLFANRPIGALHPTLLDLAPTVLKEYGVEKPGEMKGKSIF